ncbi:hypothetical protein GBA52_003791 [Prunus armeniaca]|nr:hypothetical protein GBA52_003791 [Prunus armeniaca]
MKVQTDGVDVVVGWASTWLSKRQSDLYDVDDELEEEEERADSAEEERHKKKKRKKREEYLVDEDDYELLEDNNVFAPVGRHTNEDLGVSDEHEEEFDGSGKSGRSAEKKLKGCLFGDDEGLPLEDITEEKELAKAEDDGEVGEEDEMENFIVNEEFDATGVPVRQRKLKRKKSRQALGVSSSSLHEVDEIFGDVDELLLLRKHSSDSNERRVRRLKDEFEPSIYEENTRSPPLDEISIDDEST